MRRFHILPAARLGLALAEGRDGRIFWVNACSDPESPRKTSAHLLSSEDQGQPLPALRRPDNRVLLTYYFNVGRGLQHIAGTVLEIQ